METYLTSSEVARLLGVAPSSIKRWTQAGLLKCVTTPGRHRRFTREQVDDFARLHRELRRNTPLHDGADWIQLLLDAESSMEVHAELLSERVRQGSWHAVADHLGGVLRDLGERWQRGEISVLDEHRASERLARALAACAESIPISKQAPQAFLAVANGDEHTLGLNLAELCLREAGGASCGAVAASRSTRSSRGCRTAGSGSSVSPLRSVRTRASTCARSSSGSPRRVRRRARTSCSAEAARGRSSPSTRGASTA